MFLLRAAIFSTIVFWSYSAFAEVDYGRDIRPILANHCYACHGPDAAQRKADLRLDHRDVAVESAIVPGAAEKSLLIERISSDDPDKIMPPPDASKNKPLRKEQIELLRQWIDAGAPFADHWSFVVPKRPALPQVKEPRWTQQPIDRLVWARHQHERISANAAAGRRTLIRRLSLDLIGLPPSIEEADDFVKDKSDDAYETVIDRLLASTHYGEHRARFWLDAARYADTNGYQYDLEREQWVWRDWVIHAFNSNMPFDQFTMEQLAGDLLPNATDHQRLATAFNRNHPITIEGGVIDEEYRTEYVIDRVVTTSKVWLGLTIGCARCHDHKYDPISQREFYQFFAYFNQVPEQGLRGFNPKLKIASPLQNKQRTAAKASVVQLEKRLERLLNDTGVNFADWEDRARAAAKQTWHSTTPEDVRSLGGATLIRQEDGSILASGKNPATDVYEYEWMPAGRVVAVRIEALTDASFVGGGTGRAPNANFVLSEFEVLSADNKNGPFKKIELSTAVADYSQNGYPVEQAIDGKFGRQGWAVDGNTKRENRSAYFVLKAPVEVSAAVRLKIRVVHEWGGSHQIGRFRISYSDKPTVSLPTRLRQLVSVPTEQRSGTETVQLTMALAKAYGNDKMKALVTDWNSSAALLESVTAVPATMVMSELPKPRKTHVLHRGQYDQPGEEVEADIPQAFPTLPQDTPQNRLALARWITSVKNPLTARVTVNRIWQQIFGIGMVETSGDFGTQGAFPSHPELLDWLAVDFMESGWDVKALLKQIVLSQTYRQSSSVTPEQLARDPTNRWLARGPRLRLDAEAIRDSAIAVSALLQRDVGGPSVFPYHPSGLWQEINNRPGYSRVYKQDTGGKLYRRSLYTFWKRTVPPPSMAAFDAPEREYCVVRRSRTNTPLQAFVLLNDPQYVEAARHLGERMFQHAKTDRERVIYGFQAALARRPQESEIKLFLETLAERRDQYRNNEQQAIDLLSVGESSVAEGNLAERAAWATIGRIFLNLSEFITKG
ncbi:MAG TPA: DUF1553 domain-containing protein [Planctomycetaceae bacterium]|nr:DUF1553 domain-containing protein [Planctomycetaceae bacterium]